MKTRKRLFARKPKKASDGEHPSPAPRANAAPKVADNMVVSVDYTLSDEKGKVLDSTEGRSDFSYIQGTDMLLPSIQKALSGKHAGDMINLRLLPKDGYGVHNPDAIQEIEPPLFGDTEEFEEGQQFQMQVENELRIVTVKHVDETVITVDLNHPLAGKTLQVSATVNQVRPASEIELKNQEIF